MARKCKCYHCKEWIEKDEERVDYNVTEKQKKYFHPNCLPKFLSEKELKDVETKKWNNLYDYVKVEVMGYTKEKQLTPSMRTKLLSLRNGSFVRKGVTMSKEGYDYDVILTTFKAKKIEEKVVDEKGKEKKVKKDIQVVDYDRPGESEYARFFDDGNTGWDENPEFSLQFLIRQQNWANELLNHRGYVFLNEVYDMLGIPRTKAGQIVGWVKNNKDDNADHYIDFGIFNVNRPKSRDFVNGYENVILLDFNVDGPILDLI